MNKWYLRAIISLAAALMVSNGISWKVVHDLKRDLTEVTAANTAVRSSLGDLIHAMASKDQEISRLNQSPCGAFPTTQLGRAQKDAFGHIHSKD